MLKNNGVPNKEGTSKSSIPKSVASDSESVDKQQMDDEMQSPNLDLEGVEPQNDPGYVLLWLRGTLSVLKSIFFINYVFTLF